MRNAIREQNPAKEIFRDLRALAILIVVVWGIFCILESFQRPSAIDPRRTHSQSPAFDPSE
jgi:hypothetical protein